MALSSKQMALTVTLFGTLAFILGIFAELKKPPFGTPIQGKDVLICKFPSDPSIALGALSVVAVLICALVGALSVFFPYKGKSVPKDALFKNTTLLVFFTISVVITVLGVVIMSWATIAEVLHRVRNVHLDLEAECATAKTGLFGGAAFLTLDAGLFWLVSLMLSLNAREDYLNEDEDEDEDEEEDLTYNKKNEEGNHGLLM